MQVAGGGEPAEWLEFHLTWRLLGNSEAGIGVSRRDRQSWPRSQSLGPVVRAGRLGG